MQKEFTKADLKNGMVVEYRNGKRRIVVGDILYGQINHGKLDWYDENLLYSGEEAQVFNDLDIMKVYEVKYNRGFNILFDDDNLRPIWEREETKVKRMTVEEMRQKLEELTGEKIEIEHTIEEKYGAIVRYCDNRRDCGDCKLYDKSRTRRCMFEEELFNESNVEQCYEKVEEDGRKES